jgi:hypothetical protein
MSNFEPGEYKSDKKTQSIKPLVTNPWSFSVSWTNTPNMQGTRPPNPQFQTAPNIPYILPQTMMASPSEHGKAPVGILQSRREPYGVEWYYNPYGTLESRLGTNMGA